MQNMMVEERLEHGDEFSGEYFDDNNDHKMDKDDILLDEAEEFVHTMKAEMSHSQHIDPITQFLQLCIDFCTHPHRW